MLMDPDMQDSLNEHIAKAGFKDEGEKMQLKNLMMVFQMELSQSLITKKRK